MHCAEDSIAMGGGGGAFGLYVEDDFSRGSTGTCGTFGNCPLCPSTEFEVRRKHASNATRPSSSRHSSRARPPRARAPTSAGAQL